MQQGSGDRSSGTEVFKCPDCGAPLTFPAGETRIVCPYCGSNVVLAHEEPPAPAPAFNPVPAVSQSVRIPVTNQGPQKRSSPFVGLLTFLVLIVACGLGIGVFSQVIFRLTGTFDQAMQQASANPEVTRVFGTPLQPGLFIMGQVSTSGNSGSADYDIPIYGPLQSGTLHVGGSLNRSGWHLHLTVDYEQNGEDMSIDIPAPR